MDCSFSGLGDFKGAYFLNHNFKAEELEEYIMRFQCPSCKDIVTADNGKFGKKMTCTHCNCPVVTPESVFGAGMVIGDFIIIKQLGSGGAGVVFLAHQISLDRPAALKIIKENSNEMGDNPVQDLIREARSAAKLNHPNIVQAYAVGEDDGTFYFAMEFVDGETMKSVLKEAGTIEPKMAAEIIKQIADGLQFAWDKQKLTHRDIKPDNIMYTSTKQAKLADLGLSRHSGEHVEDEDSDEVLGTPQYISPEQLTGAKVDTRSDIYSLGATFYQLVTGRFPYESSDVDEIAKQHVIGNLIPPKEKNYNVPEAINNIILKMMARYPEKRYQTPKEVSDALEEYIHPSNNAGGGNSLRNAAMSAQAPAGETLGGGLRAGGMRVLEAPGKSGGTSLKSAFHRPEHSEPEKIHTVSMGVPDSFEAAMATLPTKSKRIKVATVEAPPEDSKGAAAPPVMAKKSSAGLVVTIVILVLAIAGGGIFILGKSKSNKSDKKPVTQVVEHNDPMPIVPQGPTEAELREVFSQPAPIDGAFDETRNNMGINFALAIRQAVKNDDLDALKDMEKSILLYEKDMKDMSSMESRIIQSFMNDCRNVIATAEDGYKVSHAMADGSDLSGMVFVANGQQYTVGEASGKMLTVTDERGRQVTFDPTTLTGNSLTKFFTAVGEHLDVSDAYYTYMFYNGYFSMLDSKSSKLLSEQQFQSFERSMFRGLVKYEDESELAHASSLCPTNYTPIREAISWARQN